MVASSYVDDRIPRMAAALSYYTVFSLAPLLVISLAVAGFVFGDDAARDHLTAQFRALIGDDGAAAIRVVIDHTRQQGAGVLATVIGVATLLVGATGVFGELQDSLNTIWKVQTKPGRTMRSMVRSRLLSFAMVFGTGFLLLVSLVLSAGLAAASTWLHGSMDGWRHASGLADAAISMLVIGLLFACTFKLLPDVTVRWRDVWPGSLLTGALFTGGKHLIGLYLGKSAIASTYGAMGALAVLLVWIYFSSQMFLIGASFTRAHALLSGAETVPLRNAEWLPGHDPASYARAAPKGRHG